MIYNTLKKSNMKGKGMDTLVYSSHKSIKSARIDTSSIDPSLNKDLSDYAKTAYDSLEEIAELVPELNDIIGGFENDVLVPLKDLKITSSRKLIKSGYSNIEKALNELEDYFDRKADGDTIYTHISHDDENHIAKVCEDYNVDFAVGSNHVTLYPIESSRKSVNSGLDYVQKGDVVIAKKGSRVVGFIGQNADKTFYYGLGNPDNTSGVMVVNSFDSAARQLEKRL